MLPEKISSNPTVFKSICKTHHIHALFLFGSAASGKQNVSSDIDLLVEIAEPDPLKRGQLLLSLWDKFELFFNKKVDLLTLSSMRNPVLKENILRTKKLIYDGKTEEIIN